MDVTLRWFACLVVNEGLLDAATLRQLRLDLGPEADAAQYGEGMLDRGLVDDVDLLQQLLDDACDAEAAGRRIPFDAFVDRTPKKPISLRQPPPPPPQPAPDAIEEEPSSAAASADPLLTEEAVVAVGAARGEVPDFSALLGDTPGSARGAMLELLLMATRTGASDLHLSAEARPFIRRHRANQFLAEKPLSPELAEHLNLALLTSAQRESFLARRDFDFALALDNGNRYRVNLMVHKDGVAGTYRTVSNEVKTLEDLGFEAAGTIKKLLAYHNGLILVAGPVGSGKTTTLAALIQELNATRDDHLITVEEPIEVVHRSKRCAITQRGVGAHTRSFHNALKGALRQDPDIIVIGEMRDLATIEMAISASETGHLVIGTMHTSDAANTLNRLLDVFPPAQQTQIRAMVAESLRGIICQRLLPSPRGGLVLACEILIRNMAVSALIREGKSQGLGNIMETGKADGMISMDTAVLKLWRAGRISDEVALANIGSDILRREIRLSQNPAPAVDEPAPAASPTRKLKLF